MFFKPNDTASSSMLMHRAKYWPHSRLSPAAADLILSNHLQILNVWAVNELTSHEDSTSTIPLNGVNYTVVWAYNNPPTVTEWNNMPPNRGIRAEFRVIPRLGNMRSGGAKVCVLTLMSNPQGTTTVDNPTL